MLGAVQVATEETPLEQLVTSREDEIEREPDQGQSVGEALVERGDHIGGVGVHVIEADELDADPPRRSRLGDPGSFQPVEQGAVA